MKPGFFQNEDLAELAPETRLLFIGLWMLADREGRLEDRPKKIKMQVFPADTYSVEPMLKSLHEAKLIHRYVVDSKGYIWIPSWTNHQNPHPREKDSVIPPPDKSRVKVLPSNLKVVSSPAESLNPESLNPERPPPEKKPEKRASRIPADFSLTDDMRRYATDRGVNAEREFEKFKNHWLAAAGRNAVKKDWGLTWCNWVLRSQEYSSSTKSADDNRAVELT